MKGIILFDKELDNTYSDGEKDEFLFVSETAEMKVKYYSSDTLEKAIALCKEKNLKLHILVTRWMGDRKSFIEHLKVNKPWWYDALLESRIKVSLHFYPRGYHQEDSFLDKVSRESLEIDLPIRRYLKRNMPLKISDIQTMLLRHGWMTKGNENLWGVLAE